MLLALALSPVLVGLPTVIANPVHAGGAQHVQGSALAFIPNIVDKVLGYGHQIAQWTTGKSDRSQWAGSDVPPLDMFSTPSHCRPHLPPHAPVVVNKTIYEALSEDAKLVADTISTCMHSLTSGYDQILQALQAGQPEQCYDRPAQQHLIEVCAYAADKCTHANVVSSALPSLLPQTRLSPSGAMGATARTCHRWTRTALPSP
jgi:hypothetical protein